MIFFILVPYRISWCKQNKWVTRTVNECLYESTGKGELLKKGFHWTPRISSFSFLFPSQVKSEYFQILFSCLSVCLSILWAFPCFSADIDHGCAVNSTDGSYWRSCHCFERAPAVKTGRTPRGMRREQRYCTEVTRTWPLWSRRERFTDEHYCVKFIMNRYWTALEVREGQRKNTIILLLLLLLLVLLLLLLLVYPLTIILFKCLLIINSLIQLIRVSKYF